MHQICYSIRRIPLEQLPMVVDVETLEQRPATEQELLDRGMQHLYDDLYSCAEILDSRIQEDASGRRDRVFFHPAGDPPGELIAQGTLRARHAAIPPELKAKVFRADVVRATDPNENALLLVATNLNEQATAIAEFVGTTEKPLLDLSSAQVVIDEAERVAQLPDTNVGRVLVPMITVDDSADVVVRDGVIPHSWAGESP